MKKKYVAVMLGLMLSMSTASVYAAENAAETALLKWMAAL